MVVNDNSISLHIKIGQVLRKIMLRLLYTGIINTGIYRIKESVKTKGISIRIHPKFVLASAGIIPLPSKQTLLLPN